MKAKSIATVALLAFVGVSIVYLVIQESSSKPPVDSKPAQMVVAESAFTASGDGKPALSESDERTGHKLIAYYFHRTQRCRTCLTIETYAEEVLKEAFPQVTETGKLEWRVVNVEDSAYEHFVEDYQITSGALVLVNTQNGERKEWRNLERVWELVGDELKFKAYVEAETLTFLEQDS